MWIERQISIVKTLEPTPIPKFGSEGPHWKRKDEEEVEPLVAVFWSSTSVLGFNTFGLWKLSYHEHIICDVFWNNLIFF